MIFKKLTTLLALSLLLFSQVAFAQEDINIKVMNATHLADHQVVIAIKNPGEKQPLIVDIIDLGNYRDYKNVTIPNTEQIFLFVVPSGNALDKLNPVPEKYQAQLYPLGMDGVKGCNIVISGEEVNDMHYNMTNIQW